jgi:hypothetical protein
MTSRPKQLSELSREGVLLYFRDRLSNRKDDQRGVTAEHIARKRGWDMRALVIILRALSVEELIHVAPGSRSGTNPSCYLPGPPMMGCDVRLLEDCMRRIPATTWQDRLADY